MRFALRIASLLVVAVALHFTGAGNAGAVEHVRGSAQACELTTSQVSAASSITVRGAVSAVETSADECENGTCSGLTCQCFCHGVTALLAFTMPLPEVVSAPSTPGAVPFGTTVQTPPPVRPPKI